jgi:hypothetical protein
MPVSTSRTCQLAVFAVNTDVSIPMLFSFEPMLCEGAERPPDGIEWRYELRLDGFRAIGLKSGRNAQLWSRNQKDFNRRFPGVVKGVAALPNDTVIDGEIVALDENGGHLQPAPRRQERPSEIAAQGRSWRPTSPVNAGGSNGQSANGALAEVREQLGRFRSALEWESDPSIAQLFLAARAEDSAPQFASGEQRRRLMSALIEWILRATQVMPVVIAIEDLHWADPSTLELIDLLIQQCKKAPLMLLDTARPEFRAGWQASAHHVQITLNPLNTNSSRTMAESVAGQTTLSEETITTIVERTGGVPLFVEDLTRAVLESDNLKAAARDIPATLQDSLIARLDRLGPAKEVIQIGAVIGSEFSYEVLRAIHPVVEEALQSSLRSLVNAQLLYVSGTASDATYRFKHALIRDAAYEALLKSRRKQLHRLVAGVIDEKFPAIRQANPEVLARHWTEAGETERAIVEWTRAGKTAQARSACKEALESYQHALDLLNLVAASPERDGRELELRQAVVSMLIVTSGFSASETINAAEHGRHACREERQSRATRQFDGFERLHRPRLRESTCSPYLCRPGSRLRRWRPHQPWKRVRPSNTSALLGRRPPRRREVFHGGAGVFQRPGSRSASRRRRARLGTRELERVDSWASRRCSRTNCQNDGER